MRIPLLALLALVLFGAAPAAAEPPAETVAPAADELSTDSEQADEPPKGQKALCDLIETSAKDHDLPVDFFTRLIWKESRFREDAVSPKGAQGIAQFMPATAAERGLEDPFDVSTAVPASAAFLADLKGRFGNLGLAAAAYNAGPARVSAWLAETSVLPLETEDYVVSITGATAGSWADTDALPSASPTDERGCIELAALLRSAPASVEPAVETSQAPWGVQVAGNYSRTKAIGVYLALKQRFADAFADKPPMIVGGRAPGRGARVFYRVRIPADSRSEGEKLCARLRAAGGNCVVLKS